MSVVYGDLPEAFVIGNLDTFYNTLKSCRASGGDGLLLLKVSMCRAVAQWNCGSFSGALRELGAAEDTLCRLLREGHPRVGEIGAVFTVAFDSVVRSCIEGHKAELEGKGKKVIVTQLMILTR